MRSWYGIAVLACCLIALSGAQAHAANSIDEIPPPPSKEELIRIKKEKREKFDAEKSALPIDIRNDAAREAALSYGARGGLNWRTYYIRQEIEARARYLDKVYDFHQLLIPAPSGLLIEPPVIGEAVDAMMIADGGLQAAVADRVYNIGRNARIVSTARTWRMYLERQWGEVNPPPDILLPESKEDQAKWDNWFEKGWKAGVEQADEIFQADLNKLSSDYQGMVRYRTLLAQGMVSPPYALQVDRGVTGGGNEMRVGDRNVSITGLPALKTGTQEWVTRKPISLLKAKDNIAETWAEEPPRFVDDLVDPFLMWCVKKNSSDVSIQTDRPIYNEIYGTLYPATYRPVDAADMNVFLTKIYGPEAGARLASGTDLDLSYEIRPDRYTRIRFRVNITPILSRGRDSAQITMRVLPNEPPSMKDLNVEQDIINSWAPRQGMVVITGPTGSGKTTLLAAGIRMLMERKRGAGKIVCYEAPIEYVYDAVKSPRSLISQSEIPRHLPNFARGVRNALRRKPNVILVGEARDHETIGSAIEAAQTGHLVYTTTHTTGVAATIQRMVATFEPNERSERAYALMETIRLVVTQTLVPKTTGGRMGVREWMRFTDEVRDKLLGMDFKDWPNEIQRMVPFYGQNMAKSAALAFDEGLIDRRTYITLSSSTGAGGGD